MAKLKPILFNTAMVQKIMAGEKTETRREFSRSPRAHGLSSTAMKRTGRLT